MNQETKQKMDAWTRELNLDFGEPMTEDKIRQMEKKLDLKVPGEYKEFLLNYGCIPSMDLLGSLAPNRSKVQVKTGEYFWTSLGATLDLRDGFELPNDLIAVHLDGMGGYDCVVGKGERFGQVVYWDSYCVPDQAYPNIPTEDWFQRHPGWTVRHINSKKEDFWLRGYDFWDYLFRKFQEIKDAYEKENEK